MKEVWIVHHDSGPDNNILGVFDNYEDASTFAEEIESEWEKGVLLSSFPVPWRSTDRRTVIEIG
ncbi:MAG: hypothetical protein EOO67_10440 [Microbacterium sp.]|nr:MAG: hypothetical protein EOO67_10440 [Microbacterium sp.]